MPDYLQAQHAEILSLDLAHVSSPTVPDGEAMVVITVRPAPDESWQTWGLAFTFTQAIRLRNDLQALLRRCGLAVFLLGLLVLTGCSAKVHHERSSAEAGTQKSATEVEVSVQRPAGASTKPEPSPASAAKPDVPSIVVINVVRDDSQHLHIHETPERRRATVWMRLETEETPPADDPECVRMMREHQERVRRWEQVFKAMR